MTQIRNLTWIFKPVWFYQGKGELISRERNLGWCCFANLLGNNVNFIKTIYSCTSIVEVSFELALALLYWLQFSLWWFVKPACLLYPTEEILAKMAYFKWLKIELLYKSNLNSQMYCFPWAEIAVGVCECTSVAAERICCLLYAVGCYHLL